MKKQVLKRLNDLHDEMIRVRRELHMYPELSFEEIETAKYIASYQEKLGLEVRTNVGGNGVIATLKGDNPGKTVAIRADFDALPIQEENNVSYKSQNDGVMHACGHDAHTSIALGISKALVENKESLKGNVVFIHQHAEEKDPGGAKSMLEDNALDGVDAIFATHMENYTPVGTIWHNDEYVMGSSDDFIIEIQGIGGHAAFPQDTTDVITIGSQLVNNLQQVISRKIDPLNPAVLTIGSFHAGEKSNVIPGSAVLKGTVRTFDENAREQIYNEIDSITKHICKAFGAGYEIDYKFGYPATKNNQSINQYVVNEANSILGKNNVIEMEPNLGSEDFSYFAQTIPGTYFFTGSANEKKGCIYPYHHPKFDIDEQALLNGSKILAAAALEYLEYS